MRANETIEMVLVSAVFDQPVSVMFIDDGIYQLVSNAAENRKKDTRKFILGLPAYDVKNIFADIESLSSRNIDILDIPDFVKPLNSQQLTTCFAKHTVVIHD